MSEEAMATLWSAVVWHALLMELHASLEPVAWLLGTWRGEGRGEYPTITAFGYTEELIFGHVGKPFLSMAQRTRSADGSPLHAETGYLRATGGRDVELVIAHPFGATEVLTGSVDGPTLRLASQSVTTTPTAKRIDATTREIEVEGDVLRYRVAMAAVGEPLTHHLAAALHRVG